jgi:hypothetical protein
MGRAADWLRTSPRRVPTGGRPGRGRAGPSGTSRPTAVAGRVPIESQPSPIDISCGETGRLGPHQDLAAADERPLEDGHVEEGRGRARRPEQEVPRAQALGRARLDEPQVLRQVRPDEADDERRRQDEGEQVGRLPPGPAASERGSRRSGRSSAEREARGVSPWQECSAPARRRPAGRAAC